MLASAVHLQSWFDWLLRTTWQASVLIGLILLIQTILGRRLGVRVRYSLWLVLLIRMAMPWTPQSGLSLHNLLPVPSFQGYEGLLDWEHREVGAPAVRTSAGEALGAGDSVAGRAPSAESASRQETPRESLEDRAAILLSLLWLAGVLSLMSCIAAGNIRLRRIVRRGRTATDPRVIGILEECRRLMGIQAAVAVVATDEVHCPALCGILRPRLLLPEQTLAEGDRSALRHIFLHELAHLRRRDILVGHVASLLHVLHWFNPLIALGLRRMRADRELACDALTLSVLDPNETGAYGHTIVHQIERLLTLQPRWSMAGLCGDRARVRERIAMISRFQRGSYRWSRRAMLLVGCLACVGLTEGAAGLVVAPPSNPWDAYARRHFRTTHQDKHANIHRCSIRNMQTGKYLVVDGERVVCADEPGEAGLWEFRFDEVSNSPEDVTYYYSVAARKYLTTDERGNLAVNADEPKAAARWGTGPRPEGVWVISHRFKNGYLRLEEDGQVRAVNFGRDSRGYWDIHSVWRIKTSDNPKSNPEFQREKVPGPD